VQRNSLTAVLVVLAAGLLWGTVGPAEILAHSSAGPVALGGARILSGGLVLSVIMLVRDPGAFRALPRAAWPALLAASAATATFQATSPAAGWRVPCAIAGCALISLPQGGGAARADFLGIGCGVVAGGCFGVYTVSAKRLIDGGVNMLAAVPVTLLLGGAALGIGLLHESLSLPIAVGALLLLGGLILVSVSWPASGRRMLLKGSPS
jgi:DME family drug/metabolite transporter